VAAQHTTVSSCRKQISHCKKGPGSLGHDARLPLFEAFSVTSLQRAAAYGSLGLSMALVGSYVALSKPLVAVFPVFLLAWLRFGIGAVAMGRWLRKPADEPPVTARTRALLFLESFLGNFLFSVFMLFGVSMTTAVAAGVVMSSIPAVVAVLSWLFLRERIGRRIAAGIGCAALGIGLFSLDKGGSTADSGRALLGNLLVFAAVVCEASYVVIGKRLTEGMGPKRISAIINLVGLALVTPMGLWAALSFDFGSVAAPVWALLVFYGLAASVWTVWLWMTGLKTVPASQAGVFTVMLPISAALIGVVFMGERLTALQLLAFGIALLGLVLDTLPERRRD
jgi:drug/metabolite transporter (DMT)-like permease